MPCLKGVEIMVKFVGFKILHNGRFVQDFHNCKAFVRSGERMSEKRFGQRKIAW